MDTIRVGDIEMCYRTKGEGPPLLMIMGLAGSMDMWEDCLTDPLAEAFRLVMFDARGTGRTTAGGMRFTMKRFADDAAGLMDALGTRRAHVLGTSMGGMVAQEFALRHPEKVDRLVLLSTMCGWPRGKKPRLRVLGRFVRPYESQEQMLRQTMDMLFPEHYVSAHPEEVEEFVRLASIAPPTRKNARRHIGAVMKFNCWDRLPRIACPTLAAAGADDPLIPSRNSEIIANRIPNSRLEIFADARHGFIRQYPEEVARLVRDFLLGAAPDESPDGVLSRK